MTLWNTSRQRGARPRPKKLTATIAKKLHPNNTNMSGRMIALVAFILGEWWTDPAIAELRTMYDGALLARSRDEAEAKHFMGYYNDLCANWERLLSAAKLTMHERMEAECLFAAKIGAGLYERSQA